MPTRRDDYDDIEIIHRGPDEIAGFWADAFRIYSGPDVFTLDFVRVDVAEGPAAEGVVVARIAASPYTATRLAEELPAHWSSYASRSFPQEIRDEVLEEKEEAED